MKAKEVSTPNKNLFTLVIWAVTAGTALFSGVNKMALLSG